MNDFSNLANWMHGNINNQNGERGEERGFEVKVKELCFGNIDSQLETKV